MKQELRIKLDVSVTVDAGNSSEELATMIKSAMWSFMQNKHRHFNEVKFAEEHAVYSHNKNRAVWTTIIAKNKKSRK